MMQRSVDFEAILAELARGNTIAEGNLHDVLRFLIERAAQALQVQRVSVWTLNQSLSKLDCLLAYNLETTEFSQGEELLEVDCPTYFAALKQLRTIPAEDVETDPRTIEMRETYLRKHKITTMLDAPMFYQGEVVGVVCHEHRGSSRVWSNAEKSFAASIADFVSLAFSAVRRLEAEGRLHETADLLQTVANQMSDSFCLLEPVPETGEFLFRCVNPSATRTFGYPEAEILGKPANFSLAPGAKPQLAEGFRRAQETGNSVVYETQILCKDKTILTVEVSLSLVTRNRRLMIALIGRDISERKSAENARLEEQANRLQAQRLESLGLLAGGVAHDFNNLLVSILGNISLALHHLPADNRIKRYLTNVETTAQIGANLCNQLLTYSGKQKLEFVEVNLPAVVKEMTGLLEVSLPKGVTLEYEETIDLPSVSAEPTQLRQIILNLVFNAADAMRERKGTILVQTHAKVLKFEDLTPATFDVQAEDFVNLAADQTCVCLIISDTGKGMDETVRQRVFEPFFTTKEKGRGLGLAAIAGIVRAHHGAIKIESEPDKGTTFEVYFPTTKPVDFD